MLLGEVKNVIRFTASGYIVTGKTNWNGLKGTPAGLL